MNLGSSSLDTSVVLRLLTGEPLDQFRQAIAFLTRQAEAKADVFVSNQVLSEAYFALQSFYKIPKAEALEMLSNFVQHRGIRASSVAESVLRLPDLASAKPGFVDRLIHGECQEAGQTLVTFEKAARKLPKTMVLD